jgi:hypothetical protein
VGGELMVVVGVVVGGVRSSRMKIGWLRFRGSISDFKHQIRFFFFFFGLQLERPKRSKTNNSTFHTAIYISPFPMLFQLLLHRISVL